MAFGVAALSDHSLMREFSTPLPLVTSTYPLPHVQGRIQDFADGGAEASKKLYACVSVRENLAPHPLIECAMPLWG